MNEFIALTTPLSYINGAIAPRDVVRKSATFYFFRAFLNNTFSLVKLVIFSFHALHNSFILAIADITRRIKKVRLCTELNINARKSSHSSLFFHSFPTSNLHRVLWAYTQPTLNPLLLNQLLLPPWQLSHRKSARCSNSSNKSPKLGLSLAVSSTPSRAVPSSPNTSSESNLSLSWTTPRTRKFVRF